MLELILALFIWLFVARGLWLLASSTASNKLERQIDLTLCILWPIALPLTLIIVAFRRL